MAFPNLTVEQVARAVPEAREIAYLGRGAQKVVFGGVIDRVKYALKFLRPDPHSFAGIEIPEGEDLSIDGVTGRAKREVETMRQCNTPHLIKPGQVELRAVEIEGEQLLFFTEEFIDGETLAVILGRGPLPIADVVRLGKEMAAAIDALWGLNKIHRDIKPGNIMRRAADGSFVLLDMGLVFDLNDESYSIGPVGTAVYFSPEQMDFANRRTVLDFRSDLFSLGLVLYMMATRQHPFAPGARDSMGVMVNIQKATPRPPVELRAEIPAELNDIIIRLLAKRPSLRYRTIAMLIDALDAVPLGGA